MTDTTTITINITLGTGEPKVSVETSTVHPAVAAVEDTYTDRLQQRARETILRTLHKLEPERPLSAAELRRYVPSAQRQHVHRALDELESAGVINRDDTNGRYTLV